MSTAIPMNAPKKSGPHGGRQAASDATAPPLPRDPEFELSSLAEQAHALAFTTYGCGMESFQRMSEAHRRGVLSALHRLALQMPALAYEAASKPGCRAQHGAALLTAVHELVALTANIYGDRFEDFANCAHHLQDAVLWLIANAAAGVEQLTNEGQGS
jgi:hypothetical protein